MSALQYLLKTYPSVEVHQVVDSLLKPTHFKLIEDGRFLEIIVGANNRVKIPSNLGRGNHFELAERLLLEWGVKIGASWALNNEATSPLHQRMAMHFKKRISPPMALEQLYMVRDCVYSSIASANSSVGVRANTPPTHQHSGTSLADISLCNCN